MGSFLPWAVFAIWSFESGSWVPGSDLDGFPGIFGVGGGQGCGHSMGSFFPWVVLGNGHLGQFSGFTGPESDRYRILGEGGLGCGQRSGSFPPVGLVGLAGIVA